MSFRDRVLNNSASFQSLGKPIQHVRNTTAFDSSFDFDEMYNRKLVELVRDDATLFAQKLPEEELTERLVKMAEGEKWPMSHDELVRRVREYVREVFGYGLIDPLMKLEGITDIRIVGSKKILFWYKGIQYEYHQNFAGNKDVREWWERKLRHTPFSFSRKEGVLDAYLLDGSRINIKDEVTGNSWYDENGKHHMEEGPIVSIRRFGGFRPLHELFGLDRKEDGALELIDPDNRLGPKWAFEFCTLGAGLGLDHLNTGGTGSGKTTFANAESEYAAELIIPKPVKTVPEELVFAKPATSNATMLAAEEAPESQPFFKGPVIRAWDRLKNGEDKGEITMEDNLKHALRQFVQILLIGEIRTPTVCGMYREAVYQGNKLVYATYHAKSARQALDRFEQQLAVAPGTSGREIARYDTANIIQLVYYFERIGSRIRLKEILEIDGLDHKGNYKIHEVGKWVPTGRNDEGMLDGTLMYNGVSKRTQEMCKQLGIEDRLEKLKRLAEEENAIWREVQQGVST